MHVRTFVISSLAAIPIVMASWSAPQAFAAERHARTIEDLRAAAVAATGPEHRKIRILVVPGHEPGAGGAAYRGIMERNLALQLGRDLERYLSADGRFEVRMSRDEHGWDPAIAAIFATRTDEMEAWSREVHAAWDARVASGEIVAPPVPVHHPKAPHPMATRLYGITTWANENDVDLMLHVHFEDDRITRWFAGRRTGFAVYAPSRQFANGPASLAVAEKVLARLSTFDPVASVRFVGRGLVEDPQLIALGTADSAEPASILTEYAYIYEPQLRTPAVRALALDDMAYRTYLGVHDVFFPNEPSPRTTSVLPHTWKGTVRPGSDAAEVYALQTALMAAGAYPPAGRTKNACPRNGLFGPCTKAALKAFQAKQGVTGESGFAGEKTFAKLRQP